MRRVWLAVGLDFDPVTGTGSDTDPSNKVSETSHRKKVVRPTNHARARSEMWRNGSASVTGPRRKWYANGRRKPWIRGSWKRMGRTSIRMAPKRMHARGSDEVIETTEMTKDMVTENHAGGAVEDMDTQRNANRSRSMFLNRNELVTTS
jgi:hypothetical protein